MRRGLYKEATGLVPLPGTGSIFNDIRGDDLKRGNGGLLENLARQNKNYRKERREYTRCRTFRLFPSACVSPGHGDTIDRRWSFSETRIVEKICLEHCKLSDTSWE